jgi:hypothetical protein
MSELFRALDYGLIVLLFAILYRCRGGAFSFKYWLGKFDANGQPYGGTQFARLIWWVLPNAVAFGLLSGSLLVGVLSGLVVFAGLMIPHADFQESGSVEDAFGMAGVGAARGLLAGLPAAILWNPWVLLLVPFGALSGLAYWLGHNVLKDRFPISGRMFAWFPLFPKEWRSDSLTFFPTEWGELLTGLFWGFGVAALVAVAHG